MGVLFITVIYVTDVAYARRSKYGTVYPTSQVQAVGSKATITCYSDSDLMVSWLKDYKKIRRKVSVVGTALHINKLKLKDSGQYQCKSANFTASSQLLVGGRLVQFITSQ